MGGPGEVRQEKGPIRMGPSLTGRQRYGAEPRVE